MSLTEKRDFSLQNYFLRASSFIIAVFLLFAFISTVSAQTDNPNTATTDPATTADPATDPALTDPPVGDKEAGSSGIATTATDNLAAPLAEELSAEVLVDEAVTVADLGATEAAILPDSPLHGFKRFWRGATEVFTFNPVRDAELKLEHANQQLAEIKQLVEREGIDKVDLQVLQRAIAHFEGKLTAVSNGARSINNAKEGDVAGVEALLDDIVDKQITQQKVLDGFSKQALEKKEELNLRDDDSENRLGAQIENVIATVQITKQEAAKKTTETLAQIEDSPEQMGQRLTRVINDKPGSELRNIKHLELLERFGKDAPDSILVAIKIAKKNTQKVFAQELKSLPPAVRAEKLEKYMQNVSADETKMFKILEEVKEVVPAEVLTRIEELKEIMVNRFEAKLALINDAKVEDSFFHDFSTSEIGDLVSLDDFRDRIGDNVPELERLNNAHQASIKAFRQKFKDATSQAQADLFQKLSRDMQNPNFNNFKLMRQLEQEVREDPAKAKFLDDLERKMRDKMETDFKRDPERSAARLTSLNPKDMPIFDAVEFDPGFKEALFKKKTDKLKQHALSIDKPEDFERFYGRFFDLPEEVVNGIRATDPDFQSKMLAKQRRMEERRIAQERARGLAFAAVDYQEKELWHQRTRAERATDEEFWSTLNKIPGDDFESRKLAWQNKLTEKAQQHEQFFEQRKNLFVERLRIDPFGCDEVCQQREILNLEQEFRHEKERLADDLKFELARIESEKDQFKNENPLFGKCDVNNPRDCENYCRGRQGVRGCEFFIFEQECGFDQYFDHALGYCVTPTQVIPECGDNSYWDPAQDRCIDEFIDCGAGHFWNGYSCQRDKLVCQPIYSSPNAAPYWPPECYGNNYCGQGYYWNEKKAECVPNNYVACAEGYYYDYGLRRCEQDFESQCGDEEYWDHTRNRCVQITNVQCPVIDPITCPAGQHQEWYTNDNGCSVPGACVNDQVYCPRKPASCPRGYKRQSAVNPKTSCVEYGECKPITCPVLTPAICGPGETPTPPNPDDICGVPSCVYPPICEEYHAADLFGFACPAGMEQEWITDSDRGCVVPGKCVATGNGPVCGNNICESGEDGSNCGSDCKKTVTCQSNEFNNYGTGSACNYNQCSSGCLYSNGCPTGCNKIDDKEICGNGYCGPGENSDNCRSDCQLVFTCNQNGVCDSNENRESCWQDCGDSQTNWVRHVWTFKNGSTETSFILKRTDAEYTNHITKVDALCRATEKFTDWSAGAGSESNWQQFGIPICPGAGAGGGETSYPFSFPEGGSCASQAECQTYCKNLSSPTSAQVALCETHWPGYVNNTLCSPTTYNAFGTDRACNPSACPNGCTFDGGGCPNGCTADPVSCPQNEFNNYTSTASCSYSKCPAGCSFNSNGCPSSCLDEKGACEQAGSDWVYDVKNGLCVRKGVTCSKPTACSACPFGTSVANWCQWDNDGCPLGCYNSAGGCGSYSTKASCTAVTNCYWDSASYSNNCYYSSSPPCNNNGTCDSGETAATCASDCKAAPACGNGTCESGETATSCQSDCGGSVACDNDGACESGNGETTSTCPADCPATTGNNCNNNGYCDGAETVTSCPSECTSGSGNCPANAYNDNTGSYSCSWSQCSSGCTYDNSGCPTGCMDPAVACSQAGSDWEYDAATNLCKRAGVVCSDVNACSSCQTTGSSSQTTWCSYDNDGCPTGCQSSGATSGCGSYYDQASCTAVTNCSWANNYCYYDSGSGTTACDWDGVCDSGESSSSCPNDCGSGGGSNTACNYNGVCDSGESTGSCYSDCGSSSGGGGGCTSYSTQTNCTSNSCRWYNLQSGSSYCDDEAHTPSGVSCDNSGTCDSGENSSFCPSDCQNTAVCGDNVCDLDTENTYDSSRCISDCGDACGDGVCGPEEKTATYICSPDCPAYSCGDGICDGGESSGGTCAQDCGGTTSYNPKASSPNQAAGLVYLTLVGLYMGGALVVRFML